MLEPTFDRNLLGRLFKANSVYILLLLSLIMLSSLLFSSLLFSSLLSSSFLLQKYMLTSFTNLNYGDVTMNQNINFGRGSIWESILGSIWGSILGGQRFVATPSINCSGITCSSKFDSSTSFSIISMLFL